MADSKPVQGLAFDKVVFDCLSDESGRGSRESMSITDAKKITGLAEDSILRAIGEIRAKGYPVISQKMDPRAEDRFRLPQTECEYLEWRERLVDGIHGLISLLAVCDKGAIAQWGAVVRQERFNL